MINPKPSIRTAHPSIATLVSEKRAPEFRRQDVVDGRRSHDVFSAVSHHIQVHLLDAATPSAQGGKDGSRMGRQDAVAAVIPGLAQVAQDESKTAIEEPGRQTLVASPLPRCCGSTQSCVTQQNPRPL